MNLGGVVVVAFHADAFAGDHRDADTMVRAGIGAGETVAGGDRDPGQRVAGRGAFGIGHAVDRQRGFLAGARLRDQRRVVGFAGVDEVEVGPGCGELFGSGETAPFVFRHGARHRDGAVGQFVERAVAEIGRRDDRLLPADEGTQAEILAFLAFELLDLAEPQRMRQRGRAYQHGVGGVGAARFGGGDQRGETVEIVTGLVWRHGGFPGDGGAAPPRLADARALYAPCAGAGQGRRPGCRPRSRRRRRQPAPFEM